MFTIKRENKRFIVRSSGTKIAVRETEKEARHTVELLSTNFTIKPGHVFITDEYFVEKKDKCYDTSAPSYKKYSKDPQKIREAHKRCVLRKKPNTLFVEDIEKDFNGSETITKHDLMKKYNITIKQAVSYLRHLYIRRGKREGLKETKL